ncbi:hypothetical protein PTNB85_07732 [Pyrenophora teres f. teres]|uniref:Uncharacterized protein n=1 Tax=Pyrenophora teres f. teres TaxID=97479 RepID=A0A6S6W5K7_9PLEO|nr:hypothetical protein HRS9122_10092 [Pyrenophora teres f. teres]KAE8828545.1 hypothetical protein HRS9139_07764 [Pyrenophora teres f. teres]KAE8831145.1 hypothetical protein PTNB85_07732 [Pyrenophora teres f. teres]KAE8856854.1 hypothetical protein PTNB29_07921 [Pyrenophora teres f. teres]CAE7189353.1 hypothetical protein PTTW11_07462 [Pyrenophora teres f. teres]
MQFHYQLAFLLAILSQTSAAPTEQALEERQLTKRACAPTGQESCCLTGFYRVGGTMTKIQALVPFGTNGGLINIGVTKGCSINVDRTCATAGGCGSWAIQARVGCSGVETSVSFLDRCGS